MKQLILFLALSISAGSFSQGNFAVSGEILNGSNVNYSIYDVDDHGLWREVHKAKATNSYRINVPPRTHLIVFRSGEKVKHLYIDVSSSGSYIMNVNFDWDKHGVIYYDEKVERYLLYLVDDETVQEMYKAE